jgi:hypothetical protein
MMILDPTYLRTIYDGLNSGSLNKDNASALPMGLVGMYEAEIPPATSVKERKRFLDFFAVWALLKKEVSIDFILPLLEGWTEVQLLDYMAKYSKWFNSPVSGKFQIYHERLRVFLLQKISNKQFTAYNDSIINHCQNAIQLQNESEWESYALEHLSKHMLIPAFEHGNSDPFKKVAYDTKHWSRQIEISKGFEWTRQMLNEMMLWASKFNEEEVIECALNKVDLHHQEQNDAKRIVELVAHNDIDTALQRIESFTGYDAKGLERKFILYMLCLMELTLLESKVKPFRKNAIEKLLKHLDDSLPVDDSVLSWEEFFPSYLVFLVCCEIASFELDYLVIYKRANYWRDIDWIEENGPYEETQIKVLYDITQIFTDKNQYAKRKLNSMLVSISSEYIKQGKIVEGFSILNKVKDFTNEMSSEFERNIILTSITTLLAKHNMLKEALKTFQDINNEYEKNKALLPIIIAFAMNGEVDISLEYAYNISDDFLKSSALLAIASVFYKQGNVEESNSLINQSIECASKIINQLKNKEFKIESENYISALLAISRELANQGKIELTTELINQSIEFANSIFNEYHKIKLLIPITRELENQGMLEESERIFQSTIFAFSNQHTGFSKSKSFEAISKELTKQGKFGLAIEFLQSIGNHNFSSICNKLAIQNMFHGVFLILEQSIIYNFRIDKNSLLQELVFEFSKKGNFEVALYYARIISHDNERAFALRILATALAKQGQLIKSLDFVNYLSNEDKFSGAQSDYLLHISKEFAKQGNMELALDCAKSITVDIYNFEALIFISNELARQGNIEDAIKCALNNPNKHRRFISLKFVYFELIRMDKMEQAIDCALTNFDEFEKIKGLAAISSEILNYGKVEVSASIMKTALQYARDTKAKSVFNSKYNMCDSLIFISSELAVQGKKEDAILILEEAYESALKLSDENEKTRILELISLGFAKQGNLLKALDCLNIEDEHGKDSSLEYVASLLAEQGNFENAINFANLISDEFSKSDAFNDIIEELTKQGEIEKAIQCAYGISKEYVTSSSLISISSELAKQDKFKYAEQIGSDISEIAERHSCWKTIASNNLEVLGCEKALLQSTQFQIPEAKLNYLKGLANSINLIDCKQSLILYARKFYADDIESFEKLFQKYALRELFIEDAIPKKIDRFNKSLNIQWAIDLKNSINYE